MWKSSFLPTELGHSVLYSPTPPAVVHQEVTGAAMKEMRRITERTNTGTDFILNMWFSFGDFVANGLVRIFQDIDWGEEKEIDNTNKCPVHCDKTQLFNLSCKLYKYQRRYFFTVPALRQLWESSAPNWLCTSLLFGWLRLPCRVSVYLKRLFKS